MIPLLVAVALGMFAIERMWPSVSLPKVRAWWPRVFLINAVQAGLVVAAGLTWDRWFQSISLFHVSRHFSDLSAALIAYFVSTFIYYWWHRFRHESRFFWRLCHQLHHSPRRIEVFTSFYKHPVEITINSLLSAAIVYLLLGCSVEAGALYTFLTAIAEYFYHWNVRTPYALGFLIQRPESHRVHHQHRLHTNNFADLPVWDMLFGTFVNPRRPVPECGFDSWREDRFEDLLAFRDIHDPKMESTPPFKFLPTCIGCGKRWACAGAAAKEETSI